MVLSTIWDWQTLASIGLSIALAFFFGYLLTFQSVYRREKNAAKAGRVTLATDTVSITSMEVVDNLFILIVPGAISASLSSGLFWWSLAVSLAVAFVITVPLNRFMISRTDQHHH